MPASIGTTERLIRAAEAELIANNGHLEMLAVAKRAGCAVGSAYHHFGSKAGLIAATVDSFYGPLEEIVMGGAIPRDLPWAERERRRIELIVDYYYGHKFAPLMVGRLGREPEVVDIENDRKQRQLAEGERNLRDAQRRGMISPDLDPKVAIGLLLGGIWQALLRALTSDVRPDEDQLVDQIWMFTKGALGVREGHAQQEEANANVA